MPEAQGGAVSSAPQQDPNAPVEDKKEPAAPAKVYSQEEVDRITDKVRRNARRDTELRLRRDIQSQPQAQPAPERKDPPAEDKEPTREQFETQEDFTRASTEHAARKVVREERAKAETEAKEKVEREKNATAEKTWHGKIEAAIGKVADFEDVLEDNGPTLELIHNSAMRTACVESEIGPQIIYELCKDPKEARRIAQLPGYKQAAEIAKIEERLLGAARPADGKDPADKDEPVKDAPAKADEADPERNKDGTFKATRAPSKAPAPIEPVGGGRSANASAEPSDKDDPDTWRRKEYARIQRLKEGK